MNQDPLRFHLGHRGKGAFGEGFVARVAEKVADAMGTVQLLNISTMAILAWMLVNHLITFLTMSWQGLLQGRGFATRPGKGGRPTPRGPAPATETPSWRRRARRRQRSIRSGSGSLPRTARSRTRARVQARSVPAHELGPRPWDTDTPSPDARIARGHVWAATSWPRLRATMSARSARSPTAA